MLRIKEKKMHLSLPNPTNHPIIYFIEDTTDKSILEVIHSSHMSGIIYPKRIKELRFPFGTGVLVIHLYFLPKEDKFMNNGSSNTQKSFRYDLYFWKVVVHLKNGNIMKERWKRFPLPSENIPDDKLLAENEIKDSIKKTTNEYNKILNLNSLKYVKNSIALPQKQISMNDLMRGKTDFKIDNVLKNYSNLSTRAKHDYILTSSNLTEIDSSLSTLKIHSAFLDEKTTIHETQLMESKLNSSFLFNIINDRQDKFINFDKLSQFQHIFNDNTLFQLPESSEDVCVDIPKQEHFTYLSTTQDDIKDSYSSVVSNNLSSDNIASQDLNPRSEYKLHTSSSQLSFTPISILKKHTNTSSPSRRVTFDLSVHHKPEIEELATKKKLEMIQKGGEEVLIQTGSVWKVYLFSWNIKIFLPIILVIIFMYIVINFKR